MTRVFPGFLDGTSSQCVGLLAVVVFAATACRCQTNLTAITGVVLDETGAAVPSSAVEAKNLDTNASRTTASNEQGSYSIPLLPVGRYQVSASAPGFQRAISSVDVPLTGASLNFHLRVASASSQIVVDASVSQVALQTESHDLTSTLESVQMSTLPNNNRNLLNTATLGPSAQPATDTNGNAGDIGFFNQTSNAVYIAGLDNYHTAYLQDGVENINLLDQTANIVASVEAAQEVSTIMNNAPARFASPAVINVITKGGSNRFHGTAYDFLQNDTFNARNWFAASVPLERYNLFGANLGGPILKNRVFAFFDYSGLRNGSANVFNGRVPTLAERSGDFSGEPTIYDPSTYDPVTGRTQPFPNNQIPTSRFDQFANLWLPNYPLPNTPLSASDVNYVANLPTSYHYDQYLARGDWNISPRHQFLSTFAYNNGLKSSATITPHYFGILYTSQGLNAAVAETATITNSVVNVVKFGYDRSIVNRTQQNAGAKNYAQYYGLEGLNATSSQWAPPYIGITRMTGLGDPYSPQGATQNRYQYADEINWRVQNHSISIGGQVVQTNFDAYWVVNNNGNYSFTGNATAGYNGGALTSSGIGFADLLLGLPTNATAAVGVSADPFVGNSVAAYVQDDWKLKPTFTVNLGLRYDFAQAPYDRKGHSGLFNVALNKVIPGTFQSNLNDWGPRVGFSWAVRPSTVFRGGYGIYYAGNEWEDLQFQLLYPPNVIQVSHTFAITNPLTIENAVSQAGSNGALPSPFTMDNPFKDPTTQEFNLNVQRSITTNTLLTLGYLGNTSRHIESRADLNQAYGVTPGNTTGILDLKPNPNVNFAYAEVARATANYNALLASVNRTFANGIGYLASYTWSKAMDLLDGDNGGLESIYHPRISYAAAGWDRTHNFLLSGIYSLPVGPGKRFASDDNFLNRMLLAGWQVSGVYHLATGQPISITAINNADQSPYVQVFASRTCDPTHGFQRTRFLVYNAACFAQPANGQYGIGGRSAMRNPALDNLDFSIAKIFHITESHQVEFRAEAFDALNHPNFLAAGGVVGTSGLGHVTSSTTQRIAQFALRYSF